MVRCLHISHPSFSFNADICKLHPISVWINFRDFHSKMYANKHMLEIRSDLWLRIWNKGRTTGFNRRQEFRKKTKTSCGFELHHPISHWGGVLPLQPFIWITFVVDIAPTPSMCCKRSLFASKVFFDNCLCTWVMSGIKSSHVHGEKESQSEDP